MKTIADEASVTKATVSLALRNSPLLPETTRVRIQEIAKKMGYRPNPLVNSLMTYVRASKPPSFHASIAFVTNFSESEAWMKNPVFSSWYHGACERASSLGYVVSHFWMRESGMNARRASQVLWNRGVNGLIFAPMASAQEIVELDFSKFSSVAIGYTLREPGLPCVSSNHTRDMLAVLRNLKKLGYRHVGLAIPRSLHVRIDFAWLSTLETAHYMGCGPEKVSKYGLREWSRDGFVKWLAKSRPEVVISSDGISPNGVWSWIKALEIQVPQDLGYVDMDCEDHPDRISGIDQNVREAGKIAAEMVIAQIERNDCGVPSHPRVVLVEGDWVPGATVRQQRV